MKRRTEWQALVLAVVGCLLGGLTLTSALAQAPGGPPAAEWVVAIAEEGETLDPPGSSTPTSETYQQHVFDPLVGIEGEDLKPVGLLAERWETVTPLTWRFHLRRGVKFHNGQAFDAEDVKYSLETLADAAKSRRAHYASSIQRVEVRDAHTVDVITAKPFAGLLTQLTRLVILPKETRERAGPEAFRRQPVGTGPYRFVEWQRDQRLVLEANPAYWRGVPSPSRLVFRVIKDPSTRAAELQAGGVHIIVTPPVPQLAALDRGETQTVAAKGGRLIIYPFQLKQAPFDDVRVRQAANLAVDREAIVRNVLQGRGLVVAGPFTSAWLGYDPGVKPYPYDPARARQLLSEAGHPNGFDTTWLITSGVFLKDVEIAEAAAAQLRQVGIRVNLQPTERARLLNLTDQGNFQGISSVAWGGQFEPDPLLSWANKPYFMSPAMQALVEQGRSEVDAEKRRRIYQEFYRLGNEQAIWLFVHAQDELWAKRRSVPWTPYNMLGSRAFVYYFQVPKGR
jgi:peptide/nickel transport system substrate-binding protein